MIVYKFGGASVRSAQGIINLAKIVKECKDDLVVVISAFGKTTNALEKILVSYYQQDSERFKLLGELKEYHFGISMELFPKGKNDLFSEMEEIFQQLEKKLQVNPTTAFDFEYDQLVSLGEVLSTMIVSAYLNHAGTTNQWIDIRKVLITDTNFREANIDWDESSARMKETIVFSDHKVFLTQGFIGGSIDGYATTLGREGSDYTAAIIGNIMDAESVTVWKDVPGIMTADPEDYEDVEKIDELSFQEAIELAYYGAKVIHPKTIKPIQNKEIPLFVKSFLNPQESGTVIKSEVKSKSKKPVIILKRNQILISLVPKDFSFVIEESLSKIFGYFFKHQIRVNLIQNSAINFSLCVDFGNNRIAELMEELQTDFKILYNENVSLLTILHYNYEIIGKTLKDYKVLLEQRSRNNVRFVVK